MRILTSYICRSVQRVVRAVRQETTRQLLGLDADPDESPDNSYAAVRAIFVRDNFNDARRAHKTYVDSGGERGRHIKLGTPYFLGHQVDGSEDKLFTAVASVWQLLAIGRQINSGWPLVLHCDASFNVCRADVSLITIGCNILGGHYRNIVSGLMGGGKETKQGYQATYDACRSAFLLVCKMPACHDPDCTTCKIIDATVSQPSMQSYLSSEVAAAKELPVVGLTADSGKSVRGFARDVLHVPHFKCFNHITGRIMFISHVDFSCLFLNDILCPQVSPVSSHSTRTSSTLLWCTTSSTRGSPVQLSTHSHKPRRQFKMQCLST